MNKEKRPFSTIIKGRIDFYQIDGRSTIFSEELKGLYSIFFLMYFIVSDEESWKLFTELKNLHLLSRYCRLCVSFFQSWEAHDRFLPLKHNVWSSLSRQWMKIFEFCKKFSAFFIGHNKIHQKKKSSIVPLIEVFICLSFSMSLSDWSDFFMAELIIFRAF